MQWKWGAQKLDRVEFALSYFQSVMIGGAKLIQMYATLDSFCESVGQPLGKNDLWIAATAAVIGATLLTIDRDFDRLAPQFFARDWIDPDTYTATK